MDCYAADGYSEPVGTLKAIKRSGQVGDLVSLDVNYGAARKMNTMPRMHYRSLTELSVEELEHKVRYCEDMECAGLPKKARQAWKKAKEDAQVELSSRNAKE